VVRRLACAAIVAVFVAVPAAAQTGGAPHVKVSVKPAMGGSTTTFVVRFRAAVRTGGDTGRYYQVDVAASASTGTGCATTADVAVPATRARGRVTVRLRPPGGGHAWCPGTYHGAVNEFRRPVCAPRTACPQYVIRIGTAGRFKFGVVTSY